MYKLESGQWLKKKSFTGIYYFVVEQAANTLPIALSAPSKLNETALGVSSNKGICITRLSEAFFTNLSIHFFASGKNSV
jgi:hypothetical protein